MKSKKRLSIVVIILIMVAVFLLLIGTGVLKPRPILILYGIGILHTDNEIRFPPATRTDGDVIKVQDISYGSMPIGWLGKQLGVRQVIEGQYPQRPYKGRNFIEIDTIDGKKTQGNFLISVTTPGDSVIIEKGIRYKIEGFESGHYGSYPRWASPGRAQPFQFYSEFVATRVLEENPIATTPTESTH